MDARQEQETQEIKRSMEALMAAVDQCDPPPSQRSMGAAMIRLAAFMMASCESEDEFIRLCRSQFANAEKRVIEGATTRPDGTPIH